MTSVRESELWKAAFEHAGELVLIVEDVITPMVMSREGRAEIEGKFAEHLYEVLEESEEWK